VEQNGLGVWQCTRADGTPRMNLIENIKVPYKRGQSSMVMMIAVEYSGVQGSADERQSIILY